MKRKGIIATCFIALAAIIYLIVDYSNPKHIEFTLPSTIYSVESDYEKTTTIAIRGDQHKNKNLLGKDTFIGTMIVDNDLIYDIKLKKEDHKYFEILTKLENGTLNTIGSVMISTDYHRIWLQLDEINVKYNLVDGYISGPAENMEEAEAVARSIVEGDE